MSAVDGLGAPTGIHFHGPKLLEVAVVFDRVLVQAEVPAVFFRFVRNSLSIVFRVDHPPCSLKSAEIFIPSGSTCLAGFRRRGRDAGHELLLFLFSLARSARGSLCGLR